MKKHDVTNMMDEVICGRIIKILLIQPRVTKDLKELIFELLQRYMTESDIDKKIKAEIDEK